jgi:sugar diacid utilization regulator
MQLGTAPPSLRSWMTAVSDIARAVNAADSLDGILNDVARAACALIGFDFCAVMLADGAQERVTVAGCWGLSAEYVRRINDDGSLLIHPSGAGLDTPAARAYREGRTITVPDVNHTARYGGLAQLAPAQGYRSLLASPLRTSGGVIGLLVGYLQRPHDFDTLDVELAELLAEQTALAIETSRLRVSQQDVIAELSAANDELRRGRMQLDWAERQHQRLMQLVLDDIGLDGLVEALADILRSSITVEDAAGHVLAKTSAGPYQPPPDEQARQAARRRDRLRGARHYKAVPVAGHETEQWVAPIILGGELVGRLWVIGSASPPDPGQRRLIERFALVVGVEVLKNRHLVEVEERLSGDLLADLLRPEGVAQPQAVLDRATALGLDLNAPYVLAVVTFGGASPAPVRVATAIKQAAGADIAVLVGRYEDAIVIVVPAHADADALLRRIHAQVAAHAAPNSVTLAIAARVNGPGDYAQAYHLAAGALRLRRDSGRNGGVLDLRTLGITSLLLMNGISLPELRRFAETLIAPLQAQDSRRSTELLATLRTWLGTGCSTGATAQALVVHTNTVSYRLARIEELLHRQLRLLDTRLELQLALMVWDVMQLDSHP